MVQHGRVVVFGISGLSACVEVFDAKTGSSICKVASIRFEFIDEGTIGGGTAEHLCHLRRRLQHRGPPGWL